MIRNSNLIALLVFIVSFNCHEGFASTGQRIIKPGETVMVNYTCHTSNGKVLVVSDPETVPAEKSDRSEAFIEPERPEPLVIGVVAEGDEEFERQRRTLRGFSNHFRLAMMDAVRGLPYGDSGEVTLTAVVPDGVQGQERNFPVARVRRRLKKARLHVEQVRTILGREPVVGDRMPYEEGFIAEVEKVAAPFVGIGLIARPGTTIDTPMGPGTIADRGDRYEIDIAAEEGRMVRFGDVVGRIVKVTDRMIFMDLGHPFGGETLHCTIRAEPALQKNAD